HLGRPDAPPRPLRARRGDQGNAPAHPRQRLAVRAAPARHAGGFLVHQLRRQEDRDVDHEAGGLHARPEVPADPQHPRRAAHGVRVLLFHEMQWLAARGYVVLYPNPRGSTTYGQEFGNIIQYRYPGDDYRDLMIAVD